MKEQLEQYIANLETEQDTIDRIIQSATDSGVDPSMVDISRLYLLRKVIKDLKGIVNE